ncbi:hypothetical protein HNR73_000238 [Phytomonospora endophytica]|uniref:Uncharacterized protein n=1 Tax=Phytomonospora endophytica TaxID=714109 RepID=A0A841F849_9ACTN|nr:hypothetical protein [Phytomonospora endophytica]
MREGTADGGEPGRAGPSRTANPSPYRSAMAVGRHHRAGSASAPSGYVNVMNVGEPRAKSPGTPEGRPE